jgi:hypothetical protein
MGSVPRWLDLYCAFLDLKSQLTVKLINSGWRCIVCAVLQVNLAFMKLG